MVAVRASSEMFFGAVTVTVVIPEAPLVWLNVSQSASLERFQVEASVVILSDLLSPP